MDRVVLELNKFTLMFRVDFTEHLKLYLEYLIQKKLIFGHLVAY